MAAKLHMKQITSVRHPSQSAIAGKNGGYSRLFCTLLLLHERSKKVKKKKENYQLQHNHLTDSN